MKQKNVILMVVAVGCGLVAALLTSQMSAKTTVEQVEVLVAAKDLPVGTMLTREDLANDKMVKTKKLPKDGLPPAFVTNREDLMDKRLSRPVRTEETFNPQDLTKGGSVTLPEGYNMVSLQVGVGNAAAGFVGPGCRVNVLATVRLSNKLYAFPLLVNMLVVAVDTQTVYDKNGVFPTMNMVSFAVTQKQALLLSLAKNRGCTLELMLRHPATSSEVDKDYDIDRVEKILSDDATAAKIIGSGTISEPVPAKPEPVAVAKIEKVETRVEPPKTPEPVPVAVVKVLVATETIAPNTDVTKDVIAKSFTTRELPASFAGEALTDLTPALGQAFLTGVAKGQWVTPNMVGAPAPKMSPREAFIPERPGVPDAVEPVPVPTPTPVVKRKTHDLAVHTTSGTIIHRYAEFGPNDWRKVAELTPAQAAAQDGKAEEPKGETKPDPKAEPKKAD
jgi:Flp pilus assembly protein CpaB